MVSLLLVTISVLFDGMFLYNWTTSKEINTRVQYSNIIHGEKEVIRQVFYLTFRYLRFRKKIVRNRSHPPTNCLEI